MATGQITPRKSARGNGNDHKTLAARAAKDEFHNAQEAAETFVSAIRSSANHFGEQIGHAVSEKVSLVTNEAKGVQHRVQDTVRDRPLMALGVAAGAGALLALLARR